MKDAWGCETPSQVACWEDDEFDIEYYNCPFLFVPSTIVEWFSEYNYYKEFSGAAPDYWQQTEKWVVVASIYNSYYNKFVVEKSKADLAKSKGGNRG